MNKITIDYGKHLFLQLEGLIKSGESHKSQIASIRKILSNIFRRLTQDENPEKDDLFSHQQFFFQKYRYEKDGIRNKSHKLRKLCNCCVHDETQDIRTKEYITFHPTSNDYKNAVSDLSDIISHFANIDIPKNMLEINDTLLNEPEEDRDHLKQEDLFNNPDPRIPVVMILDTSSSMLIKDNGKDSRIDILNDGIRQFFKDVIDDERTRDSVEICIITFDESIKIISDFDKADKQTIHNLIAKGGETLMAQGVERGLELLNQRKKEYQNSGVEYYQPWLVLMTDGIPTEKIDGTASLTSELASQQKLTIFPVGISQGADLKTLERFSPLRPALRLKDYHFKEFFEWLHKSAIKLSESMPGLEEPALIRAKSNWHQK